MHRIDWDRTIHYALLQVDISTFWFSCSRPHWEPEKGVCNERLSLIREWLERRRHPRECGELVNASTTPPSSRPNSLTPSLDRSLWNETRSEPRIGDPGISDIRDAGRGGSSIKFQAGLFCKFCLSWTQGRPSLLDTGAGRRKALGRSRTLLRHSGGEWRNHALHRQAALT